MTICHSILLEFVRTSLLLPDTSFEACFSKCKYIHSRSLTSSDWISKLHRVLGINNSSFKTLISCYGWQDPIVGFSALVWPVDTCQRRVRFNNLSTVYDSLIWDYGDGTIVNLDTQTHDYFYSNGGIYSVNLIGYGGRNLKKWERVG